MFLFKKLLSLALISFAFTKESIPVLIWDSHMTNLEIPAVSALQVLSFSSFRDKYMNSFKSDNILIFLQDTLSVEDLSSHPKELTNITKATESSHFIYLPSVEIPSNLVQKFNDQDYTVQVIKTESSLGGLTLNKKKKNLIVVELPPTITNPSRKNALKKSDEVIGNVLSKISKMGPITVIYTGKKSSTSGNSDILINQRTSRSLTQTTGITDVEGYYNTSCVLLYLRGPITIKKNNIVAYSLNASLADEVTGNCSADQNTINLHYMNIKDNISGITYPEVQIELFFGRTALSWWLFQAVISEDTSNQIVTPYQTTTDHIPIGKSYSCGLIQRLYNITLTPKLELAIDGLQVEAFAEGKTRFDNSWDCVGFFTIPIWTGIFTGIVLTIILAIGLYMLSEVKTMDRFDDPKGKHFMMAAGSKD